MSDVTDDPLYQLYYQQTLDWCRTTNASKRYAVGMVHSMDLSLRAANDTQRIGLEGTKAAYQTYLKELKTLQLLDS